LSFCRYSRQSQPYCRFFFSIPTLTPQSSPLSLHDALPIYLVSVQTEGQEIDLEFTLVPELRRTDSVDVIAGLQDDVHAVGSAQLDRKSTRLNSSHEWISYAVFCLKKKISGRTHCAPLL